MNLSTIHLKLTSNFSIVLLWGKSRIIPGIETKLIWADVRLFPHGFRPTSHEECAQYYFLWSLLFLRSFLVSVCLWLLLISLTSVLYCSYSHYSLSWFIINIHMIYSVLGLHLSLFIMVSLSRFITLIYCIILLFCGGFLEKMGIPSHPGCEKWWTNPRLDDPLVAFFYINGVIIPEMGYNII